MISLAQAPSVGTLKPCPEESVDWDKTDNVFIEGDNLEVLKLLQKAYFGKIKMIYIDPPYNTGKEFIYPDKYAETLETYLEYTGQKDSEGRKFSTNADTSGRFHSRWLNMMYPRLYLAKNLLTDNGVIFISINDNEASNLRNLCDQIFGEENFIGFFVWKSRQNKDNRPERGASIDHEYVLCYGRRVRGDERKASQYSNPDNDPRGSWTSANMVGLATKDRRPNLHFDLIDPATGMNYGCPDMGWRYDSKTMARLIAESRILWPLSPDGRPRRKVFYEELTSEYTGMSSIIGVDLYTRDGTAEVNELFGFRAMDFPKPVGIIRELIEQGATSDCIVLDFFAGSCTTAHAVFAHNLANRANCKFIMVQLPEKLEEETEAIRAGYKNIAALGRERIRRAANKMATDNSGQFELTDREAVDCGFKSFRLDQSNFQTWGGNATSVETLEDQLTLHVDHVSKKSLPQDILYELLLKNGFPLDVTIKKLVLVDKEVFAIASGALLICLDNQLNQEVIDAMADMEPSRVICLDAGFQGNDQLKANAVQTFKARARNRETAIEFRTV